MSGAATAKGLAAALALVGVQVGIGVTFRLTTNHGNYEFSQASSLVLTELLKCCISLALYLREVAESPEAPGSIQLQASPSPPYARLASEDRQSEEGLEKGESERSGVFDVTELAGQPIPNASPHGKALARALIHSLRGEATRPVLIGFGSLAVLYAINNNTVFLVYRLADPGTIQLVKSSSTLITATTSFLFLGRSLRELQWHALFIQMIGLGISQVGNANIHYTISTYSLLLCITTISAIAAVLNDHFLKTLGGSIHAQNTVLYLFGIAINLVVYCARYFVFNARKEPAFFAGYGSIQAILLIVLNASVGIVITFVYKFADAIIKGLASSVATATLLLISAAFFSVPTTWTAAMGCAAVFVASFTFIRAAQKPATSPDKPSPLPRPLLGAAFVGCLIVLAFVAFETSPVQDRTVPSYRQSLQRISPDHDSLPIRSNTTAICLSGDVRSFANPDVSRSIADNVLVPLAAEADLFFVVTLDEANPQAIGRWNDAMQVLKPGHWRLLDHRDEALRFPTQSCSHGPFDEPGGTRIFWMQFRKLQLCYEQVVETERGQGWRYEFVARVRPDGKFTDPLPFTQAALPKDAVTLFSYELEDDNRQRKVPVAWASDHFAYVPRSLSDFYFSAVEQLSTCYSEEWSAALHKVCGEHVSSECLLGHWFRQHGTLVQMRDYQYLQLIDDDGSVRLNLAFGDNKGGRHVPLEAPVPASGDSTIRRRQSRRL